MDIILLQRIEKLGSIGDVVTVKDGYARNFLLPQKKALRANESNKKVFEANRDRLEAENAEKLSKFSEHLRNELNDKTQFNIINDADSLAKVKAFDEKQDLHYCNGCEITLAKELGAELVIVPNVFRMSHLISTLHVEFKEVESGKLIKRKSYDFRGNTDQAWERAIKYAMRDLKDWNRD